MSSYNRGRENRGYRPQQRRDIKSSTMRQIVAIDDDVASRYEYDDDEPVANRYAPRRDVPLESRLNINYGAARRGLPIIDRKDRQLMLQRAGKREIVFQIMVKGAARTGRDSVLKSLASSIEDFKPICPVITPEGDLEFYLTEADTAEAVRSMSRRIVDKKNPGQKLNIVYRKTPATWDPIKKEIKDVITQVVHARYNRATNSLDLTEFGTDKKFLEEGLNCALFRNEIMVYVCDMIDQHYNFITGLSVKGNRLRTLNFASTLVFRAPKVKELDLSNNGLARIEEVEKLKGWSIEKLHLENNELCNKYGHDAAAYTNAVHAIFPRVDYLDGIAVARNPFVLPDEDEVLQNSKLPPFKIGYIPPGNPDIKPMVEKFLAEFFNLYDGPEGMVSRQQLFAAYDPNATFTYSINCLPDSVKVSYGDDETWSQYIKSSHNIMQEEKWSRYREKIIYRGAMDVANSISKMPLTNHIYDTFIVDIPMITQEMMCVTLQGLLRDGPNAFSEKEGDVKFFCRSFVVLPRPEAKMAILEDMLVLTPIVVGRMIRYKSLLTKANELEAQQRPGPSGIQPQANIADATGQMAIAPPPSPSQAAQPAYDKNDPAIQQAMVDQFSQQSGMKPAWARQCLSDNLWDFDKAGRAFLEMRESIPAEAFM